MFIFLSVLHNRIPSVIFRKNAIFRLKFSEVPDGISRLELVPFIQVSYNFPSIHTPFLTPLTILSSPPLSRSIFNRNKHRQTKDININGIYNICNIYLLKIFLHNGKFAPIVATFK